jgi:hypothetical protein
VSFGTLGCNLAESLGGVAMCVAGLNLAELPVLMKPHQVSHSAQTTVTHQLIINFKEAISLNIHEN